MAQTLTNLNLNKNQLQNAIIHPLTAAPTSPKAGQIYFNSTDSTLYYYNGSSWTPVKPGGSVVDSITLSTTWSGVGPFTQTVQLALYTPTANTKVDLQPDSTVISQLIADEVQALYISNNNGTLTAYAVGGYTTASLTIQVLITEVGV